MSTTPTPTPTTASTSFWSKLKTLLPAIEMAGNVVLLASPFAAFEPLIANLENSVNPAIQSIGSGQTGLTEEITIYGSIIGVLNAMKSVPNLPADVLNQVEGYLVAAQAGLTGYVQASSGFNPANYQPVTPIQ